VKRETDNKSLHLKRSWFQKNILENVPGSKHQKKRRRRRRRRTSTFVSASTAKLDVLMKKECISINSSFLSELNIIAIQVA